jgi:RNA polymerase sigma factor (sigma-70 family)
MIPFADSYDVDKESGIIKQAQAGSQEAAGNLVAMHQRFVYNLAFKLLQDRDDAKDLTQEVMLIMLTKLSQFQFKSDFKTWLYRIAMNEFLQSKAKKAETEAHSFNELGPLLDTLYDEESMSEEEHQKYSNDIIDFRNKCTSSMLLCLDRQQRMIFTLGAIFNLKSPVAAKILDITPENFRKQLSRAKADLFQFLDDKCGLINPENPCRCHKKVKGFIQNGIIDPMTGKFSVEAIESFGSMASEKNKEFDNLVNQGHLYLYSEQPYEKLADEEKFAHLILGDPKVRDLFLLN